MNKEKKIYCHRKTAQQFHKQNISSTIYQYHLFQKKKERFFKNFSMLPKSVYNHGHNNLKLFDTLPKLTFTTSETKRDYQLSTWYIQIVSPGAEQQQIIGN